MPVRRSISAIVSMTASRRVWLGVALSICAIAAVTAYRWAAPDAAAAVSVADVRQGRHGTDVIVAGLLTHVAAADGVAFL